MKLGKKDCPQLKVCVNQSFSFQRDFTDDCFEVFTVTSKEFFNEKSELSQDDTGELQV